MSASKLPGVGTTIFTVMSRLAAEHGAINLGQGFPDFQPPERLLALVAEHLAAGHNQYAPMAGLPTLGEAIAADARRRHGWSVDAAQEVTITAGATEALFAAIHAVVRAGDEVVVLDPSYDSYAPAAVLAGAHVLRVPLRHPDFRIDYERLARTITRKTRLLIVNTPHNPTGSVLDAGDWERIADLLAPHDCYVLSDEVYEALVFDGQRHIGVRSNPRLAARSFARLFLRQGLQRDRLEGRLLHRGAGADRGIPQGAPVPDFFGFNAGPVRACGLSAGSSGIRGPAGAVLPGAA